MRRLFTSRGAACAATALGIAISVKAQAADEVDVFAATGSLTAVQQSYKNVTIGGSPDSLLVAKAVTLSTTALIKLAQGKPTTAAVTTGLALGMTCEPSPRIVVIQKHTTAIGDETPVAEVGEVTIAGMGVIQEKTVTYDGFTYPVVDYFIEPGTLETPTPAPMAGFTSGKLSVAIKNVQPTNPSDLYPGCPLSFQITNLMGELVVKFDPALPTGETELVYMVTKGTLSAARTRIGTLDAPL